MHSQARAFLQPTRANIHQYQFNNPILLTHCKHAVANVLEVTEGHIFGDFIFISFKQHRVQIKYLRKIK